MYEVESARSPIYELSIMFRQHIVVLHRNLSHYYGRCYVTTLSCYIATLSCYIITLSCCIATISCHILVLQFSHLGGLIQKNILPVLLWTQVYVGVQHCLINKSQEKSFKLRIAKLSCSVATLNEYRIILPHYHFMLAHYHVILPHVMFLHCHVIFVDCHVMLTQYHVILISILTVFLIHLIVH